MDRPPPSPRQRWRKPTWPRRGLAPGGYPRPAPSRKIVAAELCTCEVRDTTFLRSNAVTARTSSRSDVVTLSSCVRLDGTVARCANLPGRRISGLRDAWQGRSPHDRRAHTLDWGELAAKISDLRYGVTVWTLNSGKRTKTVETTDATRNARACARVMGSYW